MFSGAVKIAPDALNDFIAPSQDCVVALDGGKLKLDDDGAVGASSEDAFSTGEVALRRRKPRDDDAMAVNVDDDAGRRAEGVAERLLGVQRLRDERGERAAGTTIRG